MNLGHSTNKVDGSSTLTAAEWNSLAADVNELGAGGVSTGSADGGIISVTQDQEDADKRIVTLDGVFVGELTSKGDKGVNVNLSGNNNINIEPRPAAGAGDGKNTPGLADRKGGNIALKPGDDIELWAHKRGTSKNDEVSVKIMTEVPKASDPTKTDEIAAKLQLNTADIVLTSKDKASDSDVMNITVNQDTNIRGYLKVRAQAIDLRSETHGGIALQPKGRDSNNFENKIKFEHGGGDGLEFGTFNTEHTSLYTNDYRFKKDGVWKMATRTTTASGKADPADPTTALKYVKATDDFYDNISVSDPTATTEDIIKVASAFSGNINAYGNIGGAQTTYTIVKKPLTEGTDTPPGSFTWGGTYASHQFPYSATEDAFPSYSTFTEDEFLNLLGVSEFPQDLTFSSTISGYTNSDWIIIKDKYESAYGMLVMKRDGEQYCSVADIVSIISDLKEMKVNGTGPWANS